MATAKQLQKRKHIEHVYKAIRYQKMVRAKKAPLIKERREFKSFLAEKQSWEKDWGKGNIKKAREHFKEDWHLGPLRPNRAVGEGADKYGALERGEIRKPEVPVHMQRRRNEVREKYGKDIEWPMVVDKKKYFPIVKNDRVVVIRGREMHKIGIVERLDEDTHEVTIEDLNMTYVDSSVFTLQPGEEQKSKREVAYPIPFNDIRLVIPYTVTEIRNGHPVEVQQDVIVEHIEMERHTTGIDPFTLVDYGDKEIPKEHQMDPVDNEPIFHRYIAGTRHEIEWPKFKPKDTSEYDEGVSEDAGKSQGWGAKFRDITGKIVHPISSLRSWRRQADGKTEDPEEGQAEDVDAASEAYETKIPRSNKEVTKPPATDADTKDTVFNPAESPVLPFIPDGRIEEPPHPMSLRRELRAEVAKVERPKEKAEQREYVQSKLQQAAERKEQATKQTDTLLEKMKTPKQLKWELQQKEKKKVFAAREIPTLDEGLLLALGQHMGKNGVKPRRVARKEEDTEVD